MSFHSLWFKADVSDTPRFSVVATTEIADRDDDRIAIDGWMLDYYKRNPIMLWNHNLGATGRDAFPIGTAEVRFETVKGDPVMLADMTFSERVPNGALAKELWADGILNAVSVQFNPLHAVRRSKLASDHRFYDSDSRGFAVLRQELVELSPVPIGANQEALRADGNHKALQGMLRRAERLSDPGDLVDYLKSQSQPQPQAPTHLEDVPTADLIKALVAMGYDVTERQAPEHKKAIGAWLTRQA